jgi:CBS domain-containing protein
MSALPPKADIALGAGTVLRKTRSHIVVTGQIQARVQLLEADMIAADVMVRNVVSVKPDDAVGEVVDLLLGRDISAVPVVDDQNKVVGILSEADLIHRQEIGTQKAHHWWIEAVLPASKLADEFAKAHGQRVYEIMSADVVTAAEDTPLGEIAALLERHRIKRVPIVRDGKLAGIVSRSNLIQALASAIPHADGPTATDRQIRLDLLDRLAHQKWTDFGETNIIVKDGVVHLWGLVCTPAERKALAALAQEVPGVVSVSDEMIPSY